MNLLRIISYLFPVKVFSSRNTLHTLELEWYNGKLMLNSENANYSFGNLQEVFRMAFKDSNLQINEKAKVLLLGLGGGCVLDLLENTYNFKGQVKAIEIDPDVIEIYREYFSSNRRSHVTLLEGDATKPENLISPDEKFDLILCDLFIDLQMPTALYDAAFYKAIKKHLTPGGIFYLNSIPDNSSHQNNDLMPMLGGIFKEVRKYSYFDLNLVLVAKCHFATLF